MPSYDPLMDAIRKRSSALGYSLGDLHEVTGTKGRFRRNPWRHVRRINRRFVERAVEALGGHLTIVWDD